MEIEQVSLMTMMRTWSCQGRGGASEAEAATRTKARLCCREMLGDGREARTARGHSTVDEARE